MNLNDLKKALDSGTTFSGTNKIIETLKKSENIGDLPISERHKIFEERDVRLNKDWKNASDDDMKNIIEEDSKRIELREKNSKNEMEFAKIAFLENEIKIYNEYVLDLENKIEKKKQLISDLNAQIRVIKREIE